MSKGYSNENERARVFCDLIAMAFACDLSRSGTLMLTMAQSHMSAHPLIGAPYDLHEVGHALKTPEVSKVIAWHMTHFAYLVAKLRSAMKAVGVAQNLGEVTGVVDELFV